MLMNEPTDTERRDAGGRLATMAVKLAEAESIDFPAALRRTCEQQPYLDARWRGRDDIEPTESDAHRDYLHDAIKAAETRTQDSLRRIEVLEHESRPDVAMAQKCSKLAATAGISYVQAYRRLRLATDTTAARQFAELKVDHELARAAQARLDLDTKVSEIMKAKGISYPDAYKIALLQNPQHAKAIDKQLQKVPPAPGSVKASELGRRPGEPVGEWQGRLRGALESR
jgi:hypothetical protein